MEPLVVLDAPDQALLVLDPTRRSLLAALREPASAAGLATSVGMTRQRVGYYLTSLQSAGLVEQVGVRQWGGLTERLFQASAARYAVSPEAFGELGGDPEHVADKLSAEYVIALAGRVVNDVGALLRRARAEHRRVATLALDVTVRFATPADRAAFAEDLAADVRALAARYHRADAGGREHRVVVLAHPSTQPWPA